MKRQRGFTLLEMLAALTLMAICSTVLLVAFGQSARSLLQVAHSDRLTHAAVSVMDEQGVGPSPTALMRARWTASAGSCVLPGNRVVSASPTCIAWT